MDRKERVPVALGVASAMALVLLPAHMFVAPHLHIVRVICWLGWMWVAVFVLIALNDLHKVWWKRAVLQDYGLQHGRDLPLRRFALLLRSSRCDRELPQERVLRCIEYRGGGPTEVLRSLPGTVRQLERALLPWPLKRIKHPDPHPEHVDDVPTIQYGDDAWRDEIVHDFRIAEAILVLPLWLSEPVQWEIQTLLTMGLAGRLFFVMPASADAPAGVSADWHACRRQLRDLGIELARYRSSGAVLGQQQPLQFTRILPMGALSAETLRLAAGAASGGAPAPIDPSHQGASMRQAASPGAGPDPAQTTR